MRIEMIPGDTLREDGSLSSLFGFENVASTFQILSYGANRFTNSFSHSYGQPTLAPSVHKLKGNDNTVVNPKFIF